MLSEAVAGASRRFGDRAAVVAPDGAATWGGLHRRAEVLARALSGRGTGPGDVVPILLPSGVGWAVAAIAVDRVGATIAGVSPVAGPAESARMAGSVGARLAIASAGLAEGLPGSLDVLDPAEVPPAGDDGAEVPAHDRGPGRGYAVCFTSGTTGEPKAAMFRVAHARAVREIDLGADALGTWGGGGPMLGSTQFAHVGFVLKFPWYAQAGATLHVMRRWRAEEAIDLVARHRMPVLGVVAPQIALILRSPALADHDLSALRLVIAGGAASPPALVDEARHRLGVDYSVRWSSTESGGVGLAATVTVDDDPLNGTIGRPRPGVEARVRGEGDEPVRRGEVGELQVRSAAVMEGYLGAPAATAAAITDDGWLRTGDLALLDDRGNVVLAGRRGDMYIRGGYNVHPAEVEAVLGAHPAVADVAVVPRPDPVMGEVGVAVVVPRRPAEPATLGQLRSFAADHLARHKLPEALVVLDALPLTAADKVDRRALAAAVAVQGCAGDG